MSDPGVAEQDSGRAEALPDCCHDAIGVEQADYAVVQAGNFQMSGSCR